MMWARRLLIGSGMTVASLALASGVSGAASCGSMSGVSCSTTPTVSGTANTPVLPVTAAASQTPTTDGATGGSSGGSTGGSSSLPFTGADVAELAVIGAGAVVAGTLLTRRRRAAA
jgi:hypothetical protein